MNSQPLNRTLHLRCKATFRNVLIRNQGESQSRRLSLDFQTGKKRPVIDHPGEYYAVCCPFCNDTRFRLYINHRYGTLDELGNQQTRLAYCFNGGCSLQLGQREAYDKLEHMLCGNKLYDLRKTHIEQGKTVDIDKIRMNWPGEVVRIDKLPYDHPAIQYLALTRGFDPEFIGKFYNVHFCTESTSFVYRNRLIIPIYHNKKMVGWQARAAYDTDWKLSHLPKYITAPGTPRRQILYNLGNAAQYRTGVVVEGVTDVWRYGPMAVCTLGAAFTAAQQALFCNTFKDGSGVLLYDPDMRQKQAKKHAAIVTSCQTKLKNGFCAVYLPEGTDPGSLDRSFSRSYTKQQAALAGVKVSWQKKGIAS
jgi:hypothetical protein